MADKGKAALILALGKPSKDPEGEGDEMMKGEGNAALAKAVLAAIKADDAGALASALSDFVMACDD